MSRRRSLRGTRNPNPSSGLERPAGSNPSAITVEELYAIVRDYGQKNGYSLVLEASSGTLLYNDKTVDVTEEIVKLHNTTPHRDGAGRKSTEKE